MSEDNATVIPIIKATASRGRPPGSVSYVEVSLRDLILTLQSETAKVRVDRRWAEAVGVGFQKMAAKSEEIIEPVQMSVE